MSRGIKFEVPFTDRDGHRRVADAVFKDENGRTCIVEFKNFSGNLKKIRQDRSLSLREVERRTGVSNAYLSQIELGRRGIPNIEILGKLSAVYDVPLVYLISSQEKPQKSSKNTPGEKLSPDASFVAKSFEDLPQDMQEQLKHYLRYLLQEKKTRKVSGARRKPTLASVGNSEKPV